MTKTIWQVTGRGADGQPLAMTVSSATREGAIALAAKHGVVSGADAVPAQHGAAGLSAEELDAGLFPPVTVERISFGATVKIGIGVFFGGVMVAFATIVLLYALGLLVR